MAKKRPQIAESVPAAAEVASPAPIVELLPIEWEPSTSPLELSGISVAPQSAPKPCHVCGTTHTSTCPTCGHPHRGES